MFGSLRIDGARFGVVNLFVIFKAINRDRYIIDAINNRERLRKIAFPNVSDQFIFCKNTDGGRAFVFARFQTTVNSDPVAFAIQLRKNTLAAIECYAGHRQRKNAVRSFKFASAGFCDKGIFYGISRESLPEHGERKRKYDKVERKKAARAPQGESIEERPQEINDRQTFGHWEGDCVCGKKRTKETLFVLSERLTRNEIIIKMPDQTAASVVAALNKLERRFGKKFSQIFKSITFDNGSEFMDCAGIEKSVYGKDRKRTKVYYCHPYSAYERGTNENINKMIRRFLPKGTDFRKVTAAYIQRVETWINNYPREILGFETSGSLFERYVAEAA